MGDFGTPRELACAHKGVKGRQTENKSVQNPCAQNRPICGRDAARKKGGEVSFTAQIANTQIVKAAQSNSFLKIHVMDFSTAQFNG